MTRAFAAAEVLVTSDCNILSDLANICVNFAASLRTDVPFSRLPSHSCHCIPMFELTRYTLGNATNHLLVVLDIDVANENGAKKSQRQHADTGD